MLYYILMAILGPMAIGFIAGGIQGIMADSPPDSKRRAKILKYIEKLGKP